MARKSTQELLTARQRQIANAYASGSNYRQIAGQLFIAPNTVRTHLSAIYRKLGVTSKIDLLRVMERRDGEAAALTPRTEMPIAASAAGHLEIRQVTVVNATIDRMADVAMRLGPEAISTLTEAFRKIVVGSIDDNGGHQIHEQGAEIGAGFGVYVSDETDAERAVHCALHIKDRVSALSTPDGAPVVARIGIYTGSILTQRSKSTPECITGAAPYLAAALARVSMGGGVMICHRTRASLGGMFLFNDLGLIQIDAGSERVHGFSVIGASPADTRFAALHGYRPTPFVGRESEIELLCGLFERAKTCDGQLALITGEPGIGKSRAVNTLVERLELALDRTLVFQCSPHEKSSPLYAVAQTLREAAGVEREATSEARLAALVKLFGSAIENVEFDSGVLADLASIRHESSTRAEPLVPKRARAATMELLDRFFCTRASEATQLVIFEDMHWADPTTVEWFERVIDHTEGRRALVIATARPEFDIDLAGRMNVTSLSLPRLPARVIERIVADQSGDRPLTPQVVNRVVERSDGIPLFAEELTRSVVELGDSDETVPSTLQASLTGRLDRLGPAREVAQVAAVIGRDFDRGLLADLVANDGNALDRAVDALLASKLVLHRGPGTGGALRFKHALVRDAAYDSLPGKRRQAHHSNLADVLIARLDAGADIPRELIARHLVQGAQKARSVPYWREAARLAVQKGAQGEASDFCLMGLEASDAIDEPRARDEAVFELMTLHYMSKYGRGEVEELLSIIEPAEECALRLGDPLRQSRVLNLKAHVLASAGRVSDAIVAGRECVALSRSIDDHAAFVAANLMLGRALFAAGNHYHAIQQVEIVRDHLGNDVERGNLDSPLNQTVTVRGWLCFMRSEIGDFDGAERNVHEARRLLLNPHVTARDHTELWIALAAARLESLRANHRRVVAELESQLELCRTDFPMYMQRMAMTLGHTLVATGQIKRGLALLAEADELSAEKRYVFSWALLLAQYSRALLLAGDPAGSEALGRRAIKIAKDAGENGNAGWASLATGQALLSLGRQDEGRRLIDAAIADAIRLGMTPLSELGNALRRGALPS